MDIVCPRCFASISAENMNIQTSIAKCASCRAVFGFADKIPGAAAYSSKREIEMPKGFSVSSEGAGLVITRRWFSLKYIALLGFCVFWDGFLVFWYFLAFTKGGPMMMKLFPVVHVAVGAVITYTAVAGLVNKTKITVNMGELRIAHFPLPWPGNKTIAREEIDQLFCEEKTCSGKQGHYFLYDLGAVTRSGGRIKLVSGLDAPENALYLEQRIERFVGITDRPVAGEMRPV